MIFRCISFSKKTGTFQFASWFFTGGVPPLFFCANFPANDQPQLRLPFELVNVGTIRWKLGPFLADAWPPKTESIKISKACNQKKTKHENEDADFAWCPLLENHQQKL